MTEQHQEEAVSTETASSAVQTCAKCGETKSLDGFAYRNKSKSDRRASACKECAKIYAAAYNERNRPRPRYETRQCATCGADFEWCSMRPKQTVCQKSCYRRKGTRLQQMRRNVAEGHWVCGTCFGTYPIEDFYVYKGRIMNGCGSCRRARSRKWYAENREKARAAKLKSSKNTYTMSRYGITRDEYEARKAAASERGCAICFRKPDEEVGDLVMDHCHAGGHVRDWLCNDCNRALGLFADVPERLEEGARYLRLHAPVTST